MKRTTTKVSDLLPSLQQRGESLAPAAFLPAVPVRVEVEEGPATHAIVDTAAKISVASKQLIRAGPNTPIGGSMRLKGLGGQAAMVQIVKTSLILCDTEFSPWLRLMDVPFALVPESEKEGADLVLGFDSCLARLRLTIDYPLRQLRVSAPVYMLVVQERKAAGALAMAGVEEIVAESARDIPLGPNWMSQLKRSTITILDEPRRQLFLQLNAIHNRAVHGPHTPPVSAAEAGTAIRAAQELANWLRSEHGAKCA